MIHLTVSPGAWSRNVRSISPNPHSTLALEGRRIADSGRWPYGWFVLAPTSRSTSSGCQSRHAINRTRGRSRVAVVAGFAQHWVGGFN
jgi:hypothetical protein